jgi:hypothetical protein
MILITSPSDTEKLLKGSIILEQEKSAHKKTACQRDELAKMLSFYLDNFESQWDTLKPYCDWEEGEHYIRCAEWMRLHYKRKDSGIIWRVREYLETL